MGHFGRITSLKDLLADRVLLPYIKSAVQLNEQGMKLTTFRAFSPSNKRDYIEWLEEVKTEATRQKRLETALEWMAEGKPRNWKHMKRIP